MDKLAFREFGDYLRRKRNDAGLTQAELAQRLGYSPQFVANWERGASAPPPKALRKLIDLYAVDQGEFLGVIDRIQSSYWKRAIFGEATP